MIVDDKEWANDETFGWSASEHLINLSSIEFDNLYAFLKKYIAKADISECQTVGALLELMRQYRPELDVEIEYYGNKYYGREVFVHNKEGELEQVLIMTDEMNEAIERDLEKDIDIGNADDMVFCYAPEDILRQSDEKVDEWVNENIWRGVKNE